jgi:hypothetical protein
LQRLDRQRKRVDVVILAVEIDGLMRQALDDGFKSLGVFRLRFGVILAEEKQFARRGAAPEANIEPAAAHLIEHTDLFDHPERVIERQRIDHWPEAQPLCPLRDGGEKEAGRWGRADWRAVMLGDVIAVEAESVVRLDDLEPRLVIIRERQGGVAVQVVENTEFHDAPD